MSTSFLMTLPRALKGLGTGCAALHPTGRRCGRAAAWETDIHGEDHQADPETCVAPWVVVPLCERHARSWCRYVREGRKRRAA